MTLVGQVCGKQAGQLTALEDKRGEIGQGTLKIFRHKRGIRDNRVRDIRSILNHLYRENGRDRPSTST